MKPVREYNLGLVLRQVADHGPRSRATLALETGLNKSTVSSLVAELIDGGLLREVPYEEHAGRVGRPPQSVELDPGGPFVLGLEINVDYLAVWATDLAGAVRYRSFVANDNRAASPEAVIASLARLAETALEQPFAGSRHPMLATVAVPGLVDPSGELAVAPNLGWVDVPVALLLKEALEDPPFELRVENEANLGAVAELVEGAGRGLRDFVYVSGEVGIGAGVVLRGELFRGASGFAGEFGHLTIDPYGPPCGCGGRGCLERLAGQDALLRLAGWDSRMRAEGSRPEWPGAMLADSARAGHSRTLQALSQVGPHARHRDRLDRQPARPRGRAAWWLLRAADRVAAGADRCGAGDARAGGPAHALPRAAGADGGRGRGAWGRGAEPQGGARGGGRAAGQWRSVRITS